MTIWIPNLGSASGPIYLAIADAIETDIGAGVLKHGEKLPPQRELAYQLGVTLGTITRAYREAERRRLLRGETGRGTFVVPESQPISPLVPKEEASGNIDLACSFAYPHLNPDLGHGLTRLARTPGIERLNGFVPSEGLRTHRETGAYLFSQFGLDADPDQVAVTCGAQHGIQVLLQALFKPGDSIAVDAFTYPSILNSAPHLGLRLVPVSAARNAAGEFLSMDPDALEKAASQDGVKGVFLMPNMQNPTTHTMTLDERRALAEVACKYGLTIIEDDPYTPFISESLPSFGALVPEQTGSIASISKLISPGSRIGFVHVPAKNGTAVRNLIGESTWMASPITAELISGWIRDGSLFKVIEKKCWANRVRFEYALEKLSGYSFQSGQNKVFGWLTLPGQTDGDALEASLRHQGVGVLAARHFQVHAARSAPHVRLTFGSVQDDRKFQTAIDLVASMLNREALFQVDHGPVG
ncbi:PLP-dependent aminotransferase family protein [Roseibium hamelinense]|nr:PLP-dependent aminotransferase family protein [Roseibium hamelinense]MTI44267.1 PLP-dependent aminotransferase family protein [Roseibium hamelinense]